MANDTLRALQTASKGLLYPSEQDTPVKAFLWARADVGKDVMDEEAIKKQGKADKGAKVQMLTVEEFFAPVATDAGFQTLQSALKQHLTDMTVYWVGDTDAQVYLVGKTPEGDFAGVSIRVVET